MARSWFIRMVVACLACWAAVALGQAKEFSIPAGELKAALDAYVKQSGVQLIYKSEDVAGLKTPGAAGALTNEQALAKILEGTGFSTHRDSSGALAIVRGAPRGDARSSVDKVDRIEVTGSRLRQSDVETAQPVKIYTREAIEQSGRSTVGGFLGNLPEVSVRSSEGGLTLFGGQQTVQLRGLPQGTTLVLVNGRRIGSTSQTNGIAFNLNLIPISAIKRIEVLPLGSSAIYGSDALAGVINIVLTSEMEGGEINVRASHGDGIDDGSVSLAAGGTFGRASVMGIASFGKRGYLRGDERELIADQDYRRFGALDARVPRCSPGNVYSNTTANLPGVGATSAGIPSNPSGAVLAPGAFASSAGQPTLCSNARYSALVIPSEDSALHLTASYRLGSSAEIFTELTYTRNENDYINGTPPMLTRALVPAGNPFNPFGVPVRVDYRFPDGDNERPVDQRAQFFRPLLGLRGDLTPRWDYEVVAFSSRDKFEAFFPNDVVNAAAINAALASTNPLTALNVFSSGTAGSPEVLAPLYTDRRVRNHGEMNAASALVRGSLYELPAGSVQTAVGADATREKLFTSQSTTSPNGIRYGKSTHAFFGELRAPLLSAAGRGSREVLAVSAGVRNDDDSLYGGDTTAQLGLEVRPWDGFLLRAGHSDGFKAPSLNQALPATALLSAVDFGLRDPNRGNEPVNATVTFGPLPLVAQTGKSDNVGFVWDPHVSAGARVSANLWRIELDNRIATIDPITLVANEALFPGAIVREPATGGTPGRITDIRYGYYNFGRYSMRGVDLDISGGREFAGGRLTYGVALSRMLKYQAALAPGAPATERLGIANLEGWAPKLKGLAQVGWARGGSSVNLVGRYVGEYTDYAPSTRRLGGDWTFDISARTSLQRVLGSFFRKDTSLRFTVLNVGDRLPEYANSGAAYDPTQADFRGRTFVIELAAGW